MGTKAEITKSETTYQIELSHADIRQIMNDADVELDDGDVQSSQNFELVLKKSSGAEVILKDMTSTDTLIVRFKKVTTNTSTGSFSTINVS